MTARPVALSLFPDVKPDRPVGPIPASVQTGLNADLIASVAELYLTGSVMDATYGRGGWWNRYRPAELVAHDERLDGVDFRNLPEPDGTYDTVCFDPPYIPQGGVETSTLKGHDFTNRFGLVSRSEDDLWASLIVPGLTECARVLKADGYLLVKCMDYVNGGRFIVGSFQLMSAALGLGLHVHDVIVHNAGSGPGGHNIWRPIRARRHHSYLIVITKTPR